VLTCLTKTQKLTQDVYEESLRPRLGEDRILEIEIKSRYRKCKESALMPCLTNLNSKPSLDIPPIWISLISYEVINSKGLV
jgi:hypothetical protein